ncbi:hypothetical protein GCM10008937_13340 [Deinococcus depolymerans]|uniref:Uncharacterized protein n=1 Tax=Deinococcus depolymerans TaxID=392408 RepID=A0ABN1BX67_9DEIO
MPRSIRAPGLESGRKVAIRAAPAGLTRTRMDRLTNAVLSGRSDPESGPAAWEPRGRSGVALAARCVGVNATDGRPYDPDCDVTGNARVVAGLAVDRLSPCPAFRHESLPAGCGFE